MKRFAALSCVLILLLAGCDGSSEVEQARFGPVPYCAHQPIARTLLIAQSVPGASLVPCYDALPIGLELEDVMVDSAGTRFRFDIDRYDGPVWLHFSASCDIDEYTVAPSSRPGIEQFTGRSTRGFEVAGSQFAGGCLVFEFGNDALGDTAESRALMEAVQLITRDELALFADWEL